MGASRRSWRPSAWSVDIGLGVGFTAVVAVELVLRPLGSPSATLTAVALTLVAAACLALRRRVPLTAYAIAGGALLLESALGVDTELSPLATLIGSYSVGRYATATRAWWGPPITVVAVVAVFVANFGIDAVDPARTGSVIFTWVAAWAIGYSGARRAEDQERARRAVERQVLAEERIRMSHELHDLVGHTVNLLVVQAGGARLMIESDPDQARDLLRSMEETGRDTLGELDRMLATLRSDPASDGASVPGFGSVPGLAQLPELVGRFHDSGVRARLSVDPELRLPHDVDVAAYRIVQEALTNSLKHAAPCTAQVVVARANGSLIVEVSDTGPGAAASSDHGRGLLGIAERVATLGGEVRYGNGSTGGFRIRATIPVP